MINQCLFTLFSQCPFKLSKIDIKPFELDFGASVSMIVSPDYLLDNSDFTLRDLIPEKRKQPRRAVKTTKSGRASKSKKARTKETANAPAKEGDSLPRKIIIHKGNKFYCESQSERKLIWKCSTSRFTNCTAQLTTNLHCNKIVAAGTHDHADNTE